MKHEYLPPWGSGRRPRGFFSPLGGPARLRQSGGDAEGRGGRNKSVAQHFRAGAGNKSVTQSLPDCVSQAGFRAGFKEHKQ